MKTEYYEPLPFVRPDFGWGYVHCHFDGRMWAIQPYRTYFNYEDGMTHYGPYEAGTLVNGYGWMIPDPSFLEHGYNRPGSKTSRNRRDPSDKPIKLDSWLTRIRRVFHRV